MLLRITVNNKASACKRTRLNSSCACFLLVRMFSSRTPNKSKTVRHRMTWALLVFSILFRRSGQWTLLSFIVRYFRLVPMRTRAVDSKKNFHGYFYVQPFFVHVTFPYQFRCSQFRFDFLIICFSVVKFQISLYPVGIFSQRFS